MGTITKGVDFDTIAREWRCKWSKDDDMQSLQDAQKALEDILSDLKETAGCKSVHRVVCGGELDFKVCVWSSTEVCLFGFGTAFQEPIWNDETPARKKSPSRPIAGYHQVLANYILLMLHLNSLLSFVRSFRVFLLLFLDRSLLLFRPTTLRRGKMRTLLPKHPFWTSYRPLTGLPKLKHKRTPSWRSSNNYSMYQTKVNVFGQRCL